MTNWNSITSYILAPKFKEVCCNIAKRTGLHDDLYQELILTLLEKIHSQKEPLLRAWENKYIDWYIVSTADRMFRSNHSTVASMKYVSNSTGVTNVQYEATDTEGEVEFEEMLHLCETELGKQYWYNSKLFLQYALEDTSLRKIEAKTGIPRNSIHRTIKETRRVILKKTFKLNVGLLVKYKKTMSWRKLAKKTGIPQTTLFRILSESDYRSENNRAKNQRVTDNSGTAYDFIKWKNIALTFLNDLHPSEAEYEEPKWYNESELLKEFANKIELELRKEHWYNQKMFIQHALQGDSIRVIERKTGIKRMSIQRTLKETRERLRLVCGEKLKRLAV